MKVQYLKDYPDASVGAYFVFKKGWTAEHTESEGQARINAGICVEVSRDAFARRQQVLVFECAVPIAPANNESKHASKKENK